MSQNYTFSTWLFHQSSRADNFGDLSRYVRNASDVPVGAFRIAAWRKYLNTHNAPKSLLEGLEAAFGEFGRKS